MTVIFTDFICHLYWLRLISDRAIFELAICLETDGEVAPRAAGFQLGE